MHCGHIKITHHHELPPPPFFQQVFCACGNMLLCHRYCVTAAQQHRLAHRSQTSKMQEPYERLLAAAPVHNSLVAHRVCSTGCKDFKSSKLAESSLLQHNFMMHGDHPACSAGSTVNVNPAKEDLGRSTKHYTVNIMHIAVLHLSALNTTSQSRNKPCPTRNHTYATARSRTQVLSTIGRPYACLLAMSLKYTVKTAVTPLLRCYSFSQCCASCLCTGCEERNPVPSKVPLLQPILLQQLNLPALMTGIRTLLLKPFAAAASRTLLLFMIRAVLRAVRRKGVRHLQRLHMQAWPQPPPSHLIPHRIMPKDMPIE